MKPGPGKFFLLFIALLSGLSAAEDYRYSLQMSAQKLYEKSPLIVTFDVEQTDHSKVMFFDFKVHEDKEKFFIHRLDKSVEQSYHHDKEHYTYLVIPLESGVLPLHFDFLAMRTNEDVVESSFTGGRYNVKAVETEDTHEVLPAKTLEVMPIPVETGLFGRFTLSQSVNRRTTPAYEPVYLTIELSGIGYIDDVEAVGRLKPIPGVKYFADKPDITYSYGEKGIQTKALFRYALIASKDFTIPSVKVQAFDTRLGNSYTLTSEALKVRVEDVTVASIVDKTDQPKPLASPVKSVKTFFVYLLIYISGYLSAVATGKLMRLGWWWRRDNTWKNSVNGASDAKSLLALLMARDAAGYKDEIEKLELAVYSHQNIKLKKIKKEVLSRSD